MIVGIQMDLDIGRGTIGRHMETGMVVVVLHKEVDIEDLEEVMTGKDILTTTEGDLVTIPKEREIYTVSVAESSICKGIVRRLEPNATSVTK